MFLKQNLFNLCDVFEYIFNNKICSQVKATKHYLLSNHRRIMYVLTRI